MTGTIAIVAALVTMAATIVSVATGLATGPHRRSLDRARAILDLRSPDHGIVHKSGAAEVYALSVICEAYLRRAQPKRQRRRIAVLLMIMGTLVLASAVVFGTIAVQGSPGAGVPVVAWLFGALGYAEVGAGVLVLYTHMTIRADAISVAVPALVAELAGAASHPFLAAVDEATRGTALDERPPTERGR